MNRPRQIGTAAETAVTRWLRASGWPQAERRSLRGRDDAGDITGTPGVCWEVKAGDAAIRASDGQVTAWLEETDRERTNARADVGVLVLRRRGKASPGAWWAVLPVASIVGLTATGLIHHSVAVSMPARMLLVDFVGILRTSGYGDPLVPVAGMEREAVPATG